MNSGVWVVERRTIKLDSADRMNKSWNLYPTTFNDDQSVYCPLYRTREAARSARRNMIQHLHYRPNALRVVFYRPASRRRDT